MDMGHRGVLWRAGGTLTTGLRPVEGPREIAWGFGQAGFRVGGQRFTHALTTSSHSFLRPESSLLLFQTARPGPQGRKLSLLLPSPSWALRGGGGRGRGVRGRGRRLPPWLSLLWAVLHPSLPGSLVSLQATQQDTAIRSERPSRCSPLLIIWKQLQCIKESPLGVFSHLLLYF